MQNGICATSKDIDKDNGIFKRLFGEDISRLEVELKQPAHCRTNAKTFLTLGWVNSRRSCSPGQTHASDFEKAGHGVGSVHSTFKLQSGTPGQEYSSCPHISSTKVSSVPLTLLTAGSWSRAGVANDVEPLFIGDVACDERSTCLEIVRYLALVTTFAVHMGYIALVEAGHN